LLRWLLQSLVRKSLNVWTQLIASIFMIAHFRDKYHLFMQVPGFLCCFTHKWIFSTYGSCNIERAVWRHQNKRGSYIRNFFYFFHLPKKNMFTNFHDVLIFFFCYILNCVWWLLQTNRSDGFRAPKYSDVSIDRFYI